MRYADYAGQGDNAPCVKFVYKASKYWPVLSSEFTKARFEIFFEDRIMGYDAVGVNIQITAVSGEPAAYIVVRSIGVCRPSTRRNMSEDWSRNQHSSESLKCCVME